MQYTVVLYWTPCTRLLDTEGRQEYPRRMVLYARRDLSDYVRLGTNPRYQPPPQRPIAIAKDLGLEGQGGRHISYCDGSCKGTAVPAAGAGTRQWRVIVNSGGRREVPV